MGTLALPNSGIVYVDTQVLIYSIEKIAPYYDCLMPLWEASENGQLAVAASELAILEVLTGPMKTGDERLVRTYDQLLNSADLQLIPIDQGILREAAKLRASTSLKSPDAIHASTAMSIGCSAFITNDAVFRSVTSLPVLLLSEFVDH
ncbi:MAG: PIN domain-containing protein [Armatimonadetes bacterium]|nr:PIN domain-containing protein [Armatimonadota bacterium]